MANGPRGERDPAPGTEDDRPKLARREVWSLIRATYRASFPYVLLFVAVLLLAAWFLTEVVF